MNIYQSITTLPLNRFIDCIVDGNLYALIISGSPTDPKQLPTVWAAILQEYSEAIGTSEYKLYISLYREVTLLEIDYKSIHTLVDALRSVQQYIIMNEYDVIQDVFDTQQSLGKELNKLLKTTCSFNNKDNAGYKEELNKCIRRSKSIKIKLDLKLLAFEQIQKKEKKGAKMDRAYFDSMLITISDHAKYEIGENITVSKYCERIKRYNHYCDTLKSKR